MKTVYKFVSTFLLFLSHYWPVSESGRMFPAESRALKTTTFHLTHPIRANMVSFLLSQLKICFYVFMQKKQALGRPDDGAMGLEAFYSGTWDGF